MYLSVDLKLFQLYIGLFGGGAHAWWLADLAGSQSSLPKMALVLTPILSLTLVAIVVLGINQLKYGINVKFYQNVQ